MNHRKMLAALAGPLRACRAGCQMCLRRAR